MLVASQSIKRIYLFGANDIVHHFFTEHAVEVVDKIIKF